MSVQKLCETQSIPKNCQTTARPSKDEAKDPVKLNQDIDSISKTKIIINIFWLCDRD